MVSISKKQFFFYCHVFSNVHNLFFFGAIWRHHIKTWFKYHLIWTWLHLQTLYQRFWNSLWESQIQNENALEKFVYPPLKPHTLSGHLFWKNVFSHAVFLIHSWHVSFILLQPSSLAQDQGHGPKWNIRQSMHKCIDKFAPLARNWKLWCFMDVPSYTKSM
jgi:hypothetical protein